MAENPFNPFGDAAERMQYNHFEETYGSKKSSFGKSKTYRKSGNTSGGFRSSTSSFNSSNKKAEEEAAQRRAEEEARKAKRDAEWAQRKQEKDEAWRAFYSTLSSAIIKKMEKSGSHLEDEASEIVGAFLIGVAFVAIPIYGFIAYQTGFLGKMRDKAADVVSRVGGVLSESADVLSRTAEGLVPLLLGGAAYTGLSYAIYWYIKKAKEKTKQLVHTFLGGAASGAAVTGGIVGTVGLEPAAIGFIAGGGFIGIPEIIRQRTDNPHVKKLCRIFTAGAISATIITAVACADLDEASTKTAPKQPVIEQSDKIQDAFQRGASDMIILSGERYLAENTFHPHPQHPVIE